MIKWIKNLKKKNRKRMATRTNVVRFSRANIKDCDKRGSSSNKVNHACIMFHDGMDDTKV